MDAVNFLDVRQSSAVYADGMHDDAAALQRCIDQMRSGGTIYFPDGVYLISAALIFYSNQHLMFSDKAVLLRSGASEPITKYMLAAYSDPDMPGYEGTHDVVISGGVFDGNGALTENLTIINTVHCRNITIRGCRFVHCANWHFIEINSTKDALITDCVFDGTSYTAIRESLTSELVQLDAARKGAYGPLYATGGQLIDFCDDATPCRDIIIERCIFKCDGFPGVGHHGSDEHTGITIRENVFTGTSGKGDISRGFIFFMKEVHGVWVQSNAFISKREKDAKAFAVVIENPDAAACLVEGNSLIGNYSTCFAGGITERDNVFSA